MVGNFLKNPALIRAVQAVLIGVTTFYTVKGIEGTSNSIKRSAQKRRALARKRIEAKKLANTTQKTKTKKAAKPVVTEAVQAVMDAKSVKDLRLAAREQGVSGYSKMNKQKLAEALVAGATEAAASGAIS